MDYIERVWINKNILDNLKKVNYRDRLGTLAVIEFKEAPNQSYINMNGVKIINSVFTLMGYSPEYGKIDHTEDFQECVDSFVSIDDNVLKIRHKYWTYSKCQMFADLMGIVARYHNFLMEVK